MGGERASNADGTIPSGRAVSGRRAEAGFPNYKSGEHHPDPFASDKPLFSITAANMGQYAAKLTEGHKKLLQTYPDYKLIVYPTHRSAAFPQRIYDATKRIATTANLAPGGNGGDRRRGGIPFPIQNRCRGFLEPRVALPRGESSTHLRPGTVEANGNWWIVKLREDALIQYSLPGMTQAGLNNVIAYFIQETLQPARLAGETPAGAGDAGPVEGQSQGLDL